MGFTTHRCLLVCHQFLPSILSSHKTQMNRPSSPRRREQRLGLPGVHMKLGRHRASILRTRNTGLLMVHRDEGRERWSLGHQVQQPGDGERDTKESVKPTRNLASYPRPIFFLPTAHCRHTQRLRSATCPLKSPLTSVLWCTRTQNSEVSLALSPHVTCCDYLDSCLMAVISSGRP